jgi:antitoxin component HigA of HigAB toxin-antitoxin module
LASEQIFVLRVRTRREMGGHSDFLNGRREISKDVAKKLAARFTVRADLFF